MILVHADVCNGRHADSPSCVVSSKGLVDQNIELDAAVSKEIILIRYWRERDVLHAPDNHQIVTAIMDG